jgi:hypothetical protein
MLRIRAVRFLCSVSRYVSARDSEVGSLKPESVLPVRAGPGCVEIPHMAVGSLSRVPSFKVDELLRLILGSPGQAKSRCGAPRCGPTTHHHPPPPAAPSHMLKYALC